MSILIDASAPAIVNSTGSGSTITTASFTPPTGSLLVAVCNGGFGSSPDTATITDSLGGTWTSRVTANTTSGSGSSGVVQISTRVVSSSAAMTVTGTFGLSTFGHQLAVYVCTGADTATVGASTTLDVQTSVTGMTKALTTTTGGSLVLGGVVSNNARTASLGPNTAWAPMGGANPVSNATDDDAYGVIKASSTTGTPGSTTFGGTWSSGTNGHLGLLEVVPATNSTLSANDNTNPTADSATVQATVPATTNTGTFTDTATVSVPLPVNDPGTGADVATVRVFAGDTGAGDEATTILAGGATLKFASDTASSAEATKPLVIRDGDAASSADSLQTATLGIQGRLPPGPRIVRVGGS